MPKQGVFEGQILVSENEKIVCNKFYGKRKSNRTSPISKSTSFLKYTP